MKMKLICGFVESLNSFMAGDTYVLLWNRIEKNGRKWDRIFEILL